MNANREVVIELSSVAEWDFLTCPEVFKIVRISVDESNRIVRERGDLQDYNEHVYCRKSYRFNVEYVHGPMNNRVSGNVDCHVDLEFETERLDVVANTEPSTSQDANVKREQASTSSSRSEHNAVLKRENLNTIHETKPTSGGTHYDTPKKWTHDPEKRLLAAFTDGLQGNVGQQLRYKIPQTMDEAERMAIALEVTEAHQERKTKFHDPQRRRK
ncbi:hypothetical protein PR048_019975, partial [Dryococelus australis]